MSQLTLINGISIGPSLGFFQGVKSNPPESQYGYEETTFYIPRPRKLYSFVDSVSGYLAVWVVNVFVKITLEKRRETYFVLSSDMTFGPKFFGRSYFIRRPNPASLRSRRISILVSVLTHRAPSWYRGLVGWLA